MSGSPTPTITEFAGELVRESKWYELGVFLGLPTYELDTISREYSREGVMRCLIEMYKRMEERGKLPSWEKISAALRTMNNNRLAQNITSRYIRSSQQDPSIEVSTPETILRSSTQSEVKMPPHNRRKNPRGNANSGSEGPRPKRSSLPSATPAIPAHQKSIDEAVFLRSMRDGSGKMKYIVVTLHGPPGAGKTSVKHLILGQKPLPKSDQNSTNIMQSVRSVRTSRIASGRSIFDEITNEKILKMIAKKVKTQAEIPTQGWDTTVATSCGTFAIKDTTSKKRIDPDAEILKDIKKVLPNADTSADLFDLEWLYLIDSGGQPQFSDILPFLFHNQSLHIVVLRLTDGLNVKPPVRYYRNGQDQYRLPEDLCLTNLEYIEQMCQIAEAVDISSGFKSSVLIVGTHLDMLGPDKDQIVMQINLELWERVYLKYEPYLVLKGGIISDQCPEKGQIIFPVDAMVEVGKKRKGYTMEIQGQILNAAEMQNTSLDIPVKWLALQLDLAKQMSVLNIQQCYARGGLLGMSESDVLFALKFFKEVGLNLFYPESGSDLVFTKLDPLISRLSALLKASFIPPAGITGGHTELRKKGVFSTRLLRSVVVCEKLPDDISDADFLSLLVHLKVITSIGRDKYLLPFALASTSSSDPFELSTDKEPLIATQEENILPPGFFMMLIIQLIEDESGILSCNPGKEAVQYRNAIMLLVNKSSSTSLGGLTVFDKKRWVEFNYSGPASSCSHLRLIISRALHKASEKLTLKSRKFSFGFLCLLCGTSDHTCTMEEGSNTFTCSNDPIRNKSIDEDNKLCWLLEPKKGNFNSSNCFCLFNYNTDCFLSIQIIIIVVYTADTPVKSNTSSERSVLSNRKRPKPQGNP